MTDVNNTSSEVESKEPQKVSLADAAKRLLEQKKQAQAKGQSQQKHQSSGHQTMKSQQTKKINNQRKRMGV